MTLYDLVNSITLQGNIEIKIFNCMGDELEFRCFRDQDDFRLYYNDCEDIAEAEVTYLYPTKSCDGTEWLVVEVAVIGDED